MSSELPSKHKGISPICEAKFLVSSGNTEGALVILKEAACDGNLMACFDGGFMMVQGIGCKRDVKGGLELVRKGMELKKITRDGGWRRDGSVTEVMEEQELHLSSLFFLNCL